MKDPAVVQWKKPKRTVPLHSTYSNTSVQVLILVDLLDIMSHTFIRIYQKCQRYSWDIHICLTDFDHWMGHFAHHGSYNERMFRSCKEYDSFTKDQPISFDQQAMCRVLSVQIWDNCFYTFAQVPKHMQICFDKWGLQICCEQRTACCYFWNAITLFEHQRFQSA